MRGKEYDPQHGQCQDPANSSAVSHVTVGEDPEIAKTGSGHDADAAGREWFRTAASAKV